MKKINMAKMLLTFLVFLITSGAAVNGQISSKEIDQLVEKTMKVFDVPGIAVAVIKDGKVVHSKGYGVNSLKTKEKVNEHTLFGIASNSKAFATASIALLVEDKKLSWDDKVIDHYHEKAMAKKIKITNSCGFDSIPSDLGVRELQRTFLKKYGYYAGKVSTRVANIKGHLSGGTYASMSNLIGEVAKNKALQKILSNPYALNPDPNYQGADQSDLKAVKKDQISGHWVCPFIMAGINTKVVRRSHALMNFPYGKEFTYEEAFMCGKGFKGWIKANFILITLGLLVAARPGTLLKKILDKIMPKPGEGPDEPSRKAGHFKFLIFGQGRNGDQCVLAVRGDRDPGYGSTSKMLAESALSLACGDQLPEAYGVVTPAVALGDELFKRLEANAGVTFEVLE